MVASKHKLIYESINFALLKPRVNGRNIVGSCSVRFHAAKSLTGFKLSGTTPNNMQQGVQTDATCNRQQCWELLAIAFVCTGLNVLMLSEKNFFAKEAAELRSCEADLTRQQIHNAVQYLLENFSNSA